MKLALAALAALLVALPAASAQVADPTAVVNLANDASGLVIPLGKSATVNVTATVSFDNVVCSSAGQATVDVTVTDTAVPGITAPATFSISVPIAQNVPGTTPTKASGASQPTAFTITVAATTQPSHDHAYALSGTVKSIPSSCSNPGALRSTAGTTTVSFKTGPAPVTTTSGTSGATSAGPTDGSSGSKASFTLPLPAILGVLALAGLASRRRE